MSLKDLLVKSAARRPEGVALRCGAESVTYGELDALANRAAGALAELGVRRGDRVGVWLDKSIASVAAMQGALRAGAAYVPVDPLGPAARAERVLSDCAVRALVTTRARAGALGLASPQAPRLLLTDGPGAGPGPALCWADLEAFPAAPFPGPTPGDDELAYILYTSGSTGQPKGVCISQRNALAFVAWAAAELGAEPSDRFSNHAPFHFDLSVLDLYAAFQAGASVCVIPEALSFAPARLVELIAREQITVWYSVPSALRLMMDHGGLLDLDPLPLRALLFAGEPFPVSYVRRLRQRWPSLRLLNLYGPTETNVCTFHEVKEIPAEQSRPVPIGAACCGDRVWAVKEDGSEAGPGEEGELHVAGPTVMLGYWGQPGQEGRPYATGDVVRALPDGGYDYVGRRDHLVKVKGNRVELGEIEAALLSRPEIREAAVVVRGEGVEARLVAFLSGGGEGGTPSLLTLKRHCAERLPRYMIVDEARWLPELPRTGNGKIDRSRLARMAGEARPDPGGQG